MQLSDIVHSKIKRRKTNQHIPFVLSWKNKYEIQTPPISCVTGGPMKSALDLGYGLKFYHATCGPSASSLISSASSSCPYLLLDQILSLMP